MIILVAELNDYKATPSRRARGTVIEARLTAVAALLPP